MNLDRNIFNDNASVLLAYQLEGITVNDVVNVFNSIIKSNIPNDKTEDDFTGGYIQQLSNSNQLVLYFGYVINSEGKKTNNRATVKLDIQDAEVDMFHVGLKAKILDMKIRKKTSTKKKASMMELFGDSKRETENVCDTEIIPEPKLVEHKSACAFCGEDDDTCDC